MKRLIAFGVTFLLLALVGAPPAPGQPRGKNVEKLMRAKLKHSQVLLEGISIGDFKKISASAEELLQLTKTEEWLMHKTPKYQMHSNEFQRAAETLIRKAKEKNIDGTTLAFFDMTMSCVRCHQHVREIRDAKWPNAPSEALRFVSTDFKLDSRSP
ncbi:MAG: hypothetical protein HYX68_00125 [Planctomycetes bacterium]|nr:hypothetical protein [Planctomycetota bacterium]